MAMGTKSYFYRDGRRVSNGVVYNNDSNVLTVRDEEEAYDKIAEELGVKTLKLGYMPEGMYFEEVVVDKGYGKLIYKYKDAKVFFIQEKEENQASTIYSMDAKLKRQIWNSGLHTQIDVSIEENPKWGKNYQAQFVYSGVHYYLSGIMSQEDFEEMIKRIHF